MKEKGKGDKGKVVSMFPDRAFDPKKGRLVGKTSGGDPSLFELVARHVKKHVGKSDFVLHEVRGSEYIHIDIIHVPPTAKWPYRVFVTCGMSEKPMFVPKGAEDFRFAELMIAVPGDWPFPGDGKKLNPKDHWYVGLLQWLARLPHERRTWLGHGHTIECDMLPADKTRQNCVLIGPPLTHAMRNAMGNAGIFRMKAPGKTVHFLGVIPIYPDELKMKKRLDYHEFASVLFDAGGSELVDLERPNAAKSKAGAAGKGKG